MLEKNSKAQGKARRNVGRNKGIFDELVCLSFSLVCVLIIFIGLFQCLFFSVSDNLVMPDEIINYIGRPYSFVCLCSARLLYLY